MKALTDRLEIVLSYVNGTLKDVPRELIIEQLVGLMAIAEALPEITLAVPLERCGNPRH